MNNVKVRMITDIGRRRKGDEFKVALVNAEAMVNGGFAVIIEGGKHNANEEIR